MVLNYTYHKVTYRIEGARRNRSVILRNYKDANFMGAPAIMGLQINKHGEHNNTNHIIETALVRSIVPMKWNLHYGELEIDKES